MDGGGPLTSPDQPWLQGGASALGAGPCSEVLGEAKCGEAFSADPPMLVDGFAFRCATNVSFFFSLTGDLAG